MPVTQSMQVVQQDGIAAMVAPQWIDSRVLAANTAEAHTVPTDARFVVFSSDGDFYVRYNGTAAIPGADVTDGTSAEINPTVRNLSGVTSISLIASATRVVSMAFYLL